MRCVVRHGTVQNCTYVYHIISYHIILYRIILYHIISYYNKSHYIISYYIISYYINHIISHYTILYHIVSNHIVLYHIISSLLVLFFLIFFNSNLSLFESIFPPCNFLFFFHVLILSFKLQLQFFSLL